MALIAHWPLNGNTNDISGNKYNGTPSNITYSDGKIGQAADFNGTSSDIIVPNNTGLNTGDSNFTVSMWIYKPTVGSSYRGIFDRGYSTSYGIFDVSSDSGNVGMYMQSGFNHCPIDVSDSYGKWVHCLWVINLSNNTQRSFKNGAFHAETNFVLSNITSNTNLYMGSYTSGSSHFVGQLNDIRIYDHALTDFEIQEVSRAKILHYTFNDM